MVRIPFVADDGTEVLFREPRADDAPGLRKFINSVIEEEMSGIMMNRKITPRAERLWLESALKGIRRKDAVMLTAESNGEILGNCDASRRQMKHSHRAIIGIALAKKARGKGIGEALMRATIDLAVERIRGIEFIDLSTFEYNKRAHQLYRSLGFVKVGEIPKAVREGDSLYSEHFMVLDLKDWKKR